VRFPSATHLVVTSPDKDRLEAAIPVIQEWLAGRGLELNADKTRIVQIDDGFNFLASTFAGTRAPC